MSTPHIYLNSIHMRTNVLKTGESNAYVTKTIQVILKTSQKSSSSKIF